MVVVSTFIILSTTILTTITDVPTRILLCTNVSFRSQTLTGSAAFGICLFLLWPLLVKTIYIHVPIFYIVRSLSENIPSFTPPVTRGLESFPHWTEGIWDSESLANLISTGATAQPGFLTPAVASGSCTVLAFWLLNHRLFFVPGSFPGAPASKVSWSLMPPQHQHLSLNWRIHSSPILGHAVGRDQFHTQFPAGPWVSLGHMTEWGTSMWPNMGQWEVVNPGFQQETVEEIPCIPVSSVAEDNNCFSCFIPLMGEWETAARQGGTVHTNKGWSKQWWRQREEMDKLPVLGHIIWAAGKSLTQGQCSF